ncbi:MAG TPA: DUF72 domain-containing protein [Mycobacteriales bacterium]|nr:DUF72 domain-containing protein [Mycobacteriales bacterium]
MTVLVGTSGWQYRHWRYRYFKRGTPQNRWFEQVMRDFRTVELNVTFYRLPRAEVFAGWYARSPADAVITVKASRYLTHVKRLKDPQPSVDMLIERIRPLKEKLGPILIQLPPDLPVDVDALDATLRAFPAGLRLAVEPRHESWWTDAVRRCLEQHNAALCWADRAGPITPLWRTADWGYLRFHEGRKEPWPFYTGDELESWVDTVCDVFPDDASDVHVYFNNDPGAAALEDAITFAHRLGARGRSVSRVPAERPDLAADPEATRAADHVRLT